MEQISQRAMWGVAVGLMVLLSGSAPAWARRGSDIPPVERVGNRPAHEARPRLSNREVGQAIKSHISGDLQRVSTDRATLKSAKAQFRHDVQTGAYGSNLSRKDIRTLRAQTLGPLRTQLQRDQRHLGRDFQHWANGTADGYNNRQILRKIDRQH